MGKETYNNNQAPEEGKENFIIEEMSLSKERRGELFMARLREIRGKLLEVDSSSKESGQLLAEITRLSSDYADAAFGENLAREEGCWLVLKDLEGSEIKAKLDMMKSINISIEKTAREEDSGIEEEPTYH